MWSDIVQALGPGAIIATGIFVMFVKADDFVSAEARRSLSALIQRTRPPSDETGWAQTFVDLFDRIFGQRPLSLRFIARSVLASFFAVAIVGAVWIAITPERDTWALYGTLILGPLIVNSVPDYLSLVESRWILSRMRGRRTLTVASWLFLDVLLTALIFYVCVTLALFVLVVTMEPEGEVAFEPLRIWTSLTQGGGLTLSGDETLGLFFYSTYFTSVWIWLYATSRALLRLLAASEPVLRAIKFVLPIEEKPLRAIGTAAYIPAIAVSAIVWLFG